MWLHASRIGFLSADMRDVLGGMTGSACSHADLTFSVTAFAASARHNAQGYLQLGNGGTGAGGTAGSELRGSEILCTPATLSLATPQQCQLMCCSLLKVNWILHFIASESQGSCCTSLYVDVHDPPGYPHHSSREAPTLSRILDSACRLHAGKKC